MERILSRELGEKLVHGHENNVREKKVIEEGVGFHVIACRAPVMMMVLVQIDTLIPSIQASLEEMFQHFRSCPSHHAIPMCVHEDDGHDHVRKPCQSVPLMVCI